MRIYEAKDLEAFERDEYGMLICPSGDYTHINSFGGDYSFGEYCCFGEDCDFGGRCSFGIGCSFGSGNSFGEGCAFGKEGRFGECCNFGWYCGFGEKCCFDEHCGFGESCIFGGYCNFGKQCSFGSNCDFCKECVFNEQCDFGDYCNLENNLKFENIEEFVDRVVKIDKIGSRNGCTYFFKTLSNIYVRCGCFFDTLERFEIRVVEIHGNNTQYLKEYLGAINYIKSIM